MRKVYQRVLPEDTSKDYYYIMRETPNTTAILIEYGFIDNANDVYKLENNLIDYVEGVVKAVSNYIGIDYVSPNGTTEDINTYTVKAGDTLYSIANSYNTTVDELKNINNLTSNILTIGQIITLPTTSSNNTNNSNTTTNVNNTYTVISGDTLYSIATANGLKVTDLIELNNLSTTILTPGQVLILSSSTSPTYTTYTVKSGDTLYGIASSYGITVNEIKELNNLTSNTLSIGQTLMIPTTNTITETNYETYTVVNGDTLYKIASSYGVTVDSIKELNNLTSNFLSIGQVLQIPISETTTSNFVYTVRKGDTLYGIASNFDISIDEIMSLNNLINTNLLIGQELLIPQK